MESATLIYNQFIKIKDEKFNVEDIEHYSLSLLVGYSRFQLFILDSRNNRALIIEDFQFPKVNNASELVKVLEKIYDEHHLLKAGFWKDVKISFQGQKFTNIPTPLFVKTELTSYLNLTCQLEEDEKIHYYKHINADCTTVFAVNDNLYSFFENQYSNVSLHFIPNGSAFIEGILKYDDHTLYSSLFLSFDDHSFSAIVTENKKLKFFNRFEITEPEMALKYVMHIITEMKLDQNSTKVLVWGDIDSQSDQFQLLYKYIKNISFGSRPKHLQMGYAFDEIPEHQYFDLFNIHPCD